MPSDPRTPHPAPAAPVVQPFPLNRHPSTQQHLADLESGHLSQPLRDVAVIIETAAHQLVDQLPDGPRLTRALEYLVLAKDAMVRTRVAQLKGEDYDFPTAPAPVKRVTEVSADDRIVANMQRKAAEKGVTI